MMTQYPCLLAYHFSKWFEDEGQSYESKSGYLGPLIFYSREFGKRNNMRVNRGAL